MRSVKGEACPFCGAQALSAIESDVHVLLPKRAKSATSELDANSTYQRTNHHPSHSNPNKKTLTQSRTQSVSHTVSNTHFTFHLQYLALPTSAGNLRRCGSGESSAVSRSSERHRRRPCPLLPSRCLGGLRVRSEGPPSRDAWWTCTSATSGRSLTLRKRVDC